VFVQLLLQTLRADASEMLNAAKSESDRGRRLTDRLQKHVKTSDLQLADARVKLMSVKHDLEASDNRFKSTLSVGLVAIGLLAL